MNCIKRVIESFKRIFNVKPQRKMISIPATIKKVESFADSIKVIPIEKNKKRVETLVCVGDGLGIQSKIEY